MSKDTSHDYFYNGFFQNERTSAPTTEPIAIDARYNGQLPIVAITKIPPCGALNVQLKAIDKPPAIAEPRTHEGMTRTGSLAANGIAPYEMNDKPIT